MIVKIIARIVKTLWILCYDLYIIYDAYNCTFQKPTHPPTHPPNIRKYNECIKTELIN